MFEFHSIRGKAMGIALLALFFPLCAAITATYLLSKSARESAVVSDQDIPAVLALTEVTVLQLEQAIQFERGVALGSQLHHRPDLQVRFEDSALSFDLLAVRADMAFERLFVLMERVKVQSDFSKEFADALSLARTARRDHQAYGLAAREVFDDLRSGDVEAGISGAAAIVAIEEGLDRALTSALREIELLTAAAAGRVGANERTAYLITLALTIIALVAGPLLATYVARTVSDSIRKASRLLEQLSTGKTDIDINIGGMRAAETFILERAVEDFRDNLMQNRDLQERQEADQRQIAENETLFRAIHDRIFDGIITIDREGKVRSLNPAASRMFGYAPAEVVGQHVSLLAPETPDGARDDFFGGYLQSEHAKGIGREVQGMRGGGEVFPMELEVAELALEQELLFLGIVRDLTERKNLEDRLRRSQRMEAVGQLTGGVAHDFNNILAGIGLNTGLIQDRMQGDEIGLRILEQVERSVERGKSLTGRLLSFSRQQPLVPRPADVNRLLLDLEPLLAQTLGETIELTVTKNEKLWPALIDAHQFENAIVNLVINARDALPGGGGLRIESHNINLSARVAELYDEVEPGPYVSITVRDNGEGMAPEVLDKVFEPFFTTKDVGKGSGLGLSMVYGFVKQSKGHVTIDSDMGVGTTVTLFLPRSKEAVALPPSLPELPQGEGGSERILVVEDDEDLRHATVTILSNNGYKVVAAQNGDEAIDRLKGDGQFHLMFTDLVLPGRLNGPDVAEVARRLQPDAKVLYATGHADPRPAAVAAGSEDWPSGLLIRKPCRRGELLNKIRFLLDGA